jgi:hypothetical protein
VSVLAENKVHRRLDLYWIPVGAGTPVVRISVGIFEAMSAAVQRRKRCTLLHAALLATTEYGTIAVEVAPTPDAFGRRDRGVVAEGTVGLSCLHRLRMFRYEVRRWPNGVIPDLRHAVASPVLLTEDDHLVQRCLDLIAHVPTPVWGRDELHLGEMWNSNSVVSWVLSQAELLPVVKFPPGLARAPGWDAGIRAADKTSIRTGELCSTASSRS